MLTIHKTIQGRMSRLDAVEDGSWVNLINPSEDELVTVSSLLGVDPTFLRAALDEEETSRIDSEDGFFPVSGLTTFSLILSKPTRSRSTSKK